MIARWTAGLFWLLISVAAVMLPASLLVATPALAASAAGNVPPEIAAHFTPEEVARGHVYTYGRYWLAASGMTLRLSVLLLLVLTPASAAIRNLAVRLSPSRPALAVAIFVALSVLVFELVTLPLGYYAGFIREHAFHLSTQTRAAWLLDRLKGAILTLVLTVPLGSLLVLLWCRYPGRWVLPAWTLCGAATILLVALALAQKAGLHVKQIYEMDASRRTRKGNAYFTGLGRTKRVVLYDTLIAGSTPDEVELVVAHELGHWQHAHIWKGIGLSLLGLAIGLWCAARVLACAGRRGSFHLGGPADVAGLPLFLLVLFVLSLVSLPIQNAISRSFERQADLTSLELTGNPEAFIRSEVQLARSNLADLTPPQAVVWLLYTHPPVAERIRMAEAFADTARARP